MKSAVLRSVELFEIRVPSGSRRRVEEAMRRMADLLEAQFEVTAAVRKALASSR